MGPQFCLRSVDRITPKGFVETFDIYELRNETASAGVDEQRFCSEWETVFVALRNGPLAVAETELGLFLERYPLDGVARYHRSICDEAATLSRYRAQDLEATRVGSGSG